MKKEMKEFDEGYIKAIMACDDPQMKIEKTSVAEKEIEKQQPFAETQKRNEKQNARNYEELFLMRKLSFDRRQCYISVDTYHKIKGYFAVIGGKVSMTVYLDNILCQHMEQYKEEINNLYAQKIKKPF